MFEQNNELQIARRKLTTAVETDDLTGLKNRRHAMERMRQGWSNAERTGNPFSLIVIDVDHFKRINDAHGHDVGDLVLQELASRFRAVTRDEEVVCRLGGEEFLVVCSNTTLGEAHKVAERIRKVVRDTPFQLPGGPQRITLSLGVATRTPRMESFMDLLKVADVAVYSAKEGGRDRIVAEGEALGGDDLRRIA
jgi:diguanylate cyclase (GGDEF)-like protein